MKNGRSRHILNRPQSAPHELSRFFAFLMTLAMLCLPAPVGTYAESGQSGNEPANRREPAQQLLSDVVWNETRVQENDHSYWRYRESRLKDGKTELLEVFETPKGHIHRLLAIDGVALSGPQREAEDRRIQTLLNHPEQIEQEQKKRRQDDDEEVRLLKTFPSAFKCRYDGEQDGAIKLAFTPNPNFHPPNHEAEVFHHMNGTMLVDPHTKRMLEINGLLTSEVKFGGGFLGHLNKGGTFRVTQRDVGGGHWDQTLIDVHMDGRALFFKTIAVREKESYSNYQRLPSNISLHQAGQMLRTAASSS